MNGALNPSDASGSADPEAGSELEDKVTPLLGLRENQCNGRTKSISLGTQLPYSVIQESSETLAELLKRLKLWETSDCPVANLPEKEPVRFGVGLMVALSPLRGSA